MHRHAVSAGIVAWLVVLGARPLQAQRATPPPIPTLDEPRPWPIFPALLVPFSVPEEYCREGRTPRVQLRVFDGLTAPIATLTLRGRAARPLDGRPLRCGAWVAHWDGAWGSPPRLASNAVYWLQLSVDTSSATPGQRPPVLRTRKLVVAY
ncbi:MAG TPA: hypothetical protein VFN22_12860 [Gemmatimonadales bacterium]|nr:hypothetical protein [Gemmatimonadales bacterium]